MNTIIITIIIISIYILIPVIRGGYIVIQFKRRSDSGLKKLESDLAASLKVFKETGDNEAFQKKIEEQWEESNKSLHKYDNIAKDHFWKLWIWDFEKLSNLKKKLKK